MTRGASFDAKRGTEDVGVSAEEVWGTLDAACFPFSPLHQHGVVICLVDVDSVGTRERGENLGLRVVSALLEERITETVAAQYPLRLYQLRLVYHVRERICPRR